MGKLSKDRRDVFYRKAKEEGYRARSAYKLLHIDDSTGILSSLVERDHDDGDLQFRAVDLCAAPGGWSQVISRRLTAAYQRDLESSISKKTAVPLAPLIVAVDLQEMAPIEGVITLQGDITSRKTADEILTIFDGRRAHLVVCDGAPDVTGMHDLDEYIQGQLLFAAARMATLLLKPGASFVAKLFRGESCGLQLCQLQLFFDDVSCYKPASSRISSYESFVVCNGFRYPIGFEPSRYTTHLEFQDGIWNCIEQMEKENVGNLSSLVVPKLLIHSGDDIESVSEYHERDQHKSSWDKSQEELDLPHSDIDDCERMLLKLKATNVRFFACGDLSGFDSDTTHPLAVRHLTHIAFLNGTFQAGHLFTEPVQAPLNPPYKEALERKRGLR